MAEPELEAADAIDKIDRDNHAAALEAAADFPFADDAPVDDEPEVEAKPEATEAKPEAAEKVEPEKPTEAELRGTRALEELAAQKRREREAHEARRRREQQERDLDREREEFERQRREFAAREQALRQDPASYLQQYHQMDATTAAERLVARQLRPETEAIREELAAERKAREEFQRRYETEAQARAREAQEAQQRAHIEQTYAEFDAVAGDKARFPRVARLPPTLRRRYGDYVADLYREAGRQWTMEEIAAQIEHDLAGEEEPAGAPGSGGRDETAGANGAGTKRPPETLTNDLASQTAGSVRDMLDPSILRKNAMRAAAKLKW